MITMDYSACKRKDSLLPGILGVVILKMVSKGPKHGYAIHEELKKLLDRDLPKALIYVTLRRLEEKGLVYSKWEVSQQGPAKRVYYITGEGEKVLGHKIECLKRFIALLQKIIEY